MTPALSIRPGLLHPDPSYVWRPDRLVRRAYTSVRKEERPLVTLPWGARLEVDATELLGEGIARLGTYELAVSEAMWRLADPGDLALDVGANVGYYACLLAYRGCRVRAFEPHPDLFRHLRENTERWDGVDVEAWEVAASDASGSARLNVPEQFTGNTGVATLSGDSAGEGFEVRTRRLDEVVGDESVGVLKVDVEGHELAVLAGLEEALRERRVRDVFFEEYDALPTPVSARLEERGFRIYALQQKLRGVELGAVDGPRPRWYAPTYLATLDPARTSRRLDPRGWNCLRPRPRHERGRA